MRAVILAAGRGSRMTGLTDDRPKCMVELCGHTLLRRQMAALARGGATEIAVVSGYRPESFGARVAHAFHNPRWASTNMVTSLAAADAWLQEAPALVSYSDIFYSSDLARRLVAAPGDLVVAYDRSWLTLWALRFQDPLSDAETFRLDRQGALCEIGGQASTTDEIEGQYMGLFKMTPTAWRWCCALRDSHPPEKRDRMDVTSLLRELVASGRRIDTLATDGQWGEIDSPSDLALYEAMVADGSLVLEDPDEPPPPPIKRSDSK